SEEHTSELQSLTNLVCRLLLEKKFNVCVESSRPALVQLGKLMIKAFHNSGRVFTAESDGLTKELPRLMHRYGLQDVQTRAYALEYRADTPLGRLFFYYLKLLYRVVEPFLPQPTVVPG